LNKDLEESKIEVSLPSGSSWKLEKRRKLMVVNLNDEEKRISRTK